MRKLALLFIFCFISQILFSQINFFKIFPFNQPSVYAYSTVAYAIETADGGYMMFSNENVGTDTEILMTKLDQNANVEWYKRVDNPTNNDILVSALQNTDGEYVIASTYDLNSTIYEEEVNYWRTDSLGNVLIYRFLTMSGICCWDYTTANVIQTSDGNYVFSHLNFGISSSYAGIRKIDDAGNSVWSGNFGSYTRINKVLETATNNLIFVGYELNGSKRARLEKWSAAGVHQSMRNYSHPLTQIGSTNSTQAILELNDGFLFPINFTDDGTNFHVWLVKTDLNLDTVWTKTYMNYGAIMGIDTLATGNVVMAGTKTNPSTDMDLRLIVLDNNYDVLFTREIGTEKRDFPNVFSKHSDGTFILSGVSGDLGVNQKDLFLVKLDTNLCVKPIANFVQDTSIHFLPGESGLAFVDQTNYYMTDSSAYSWNWDFGDGNTSTLENPSHIYASQGNYLVTLIANNGCSSDTIQFPFNAVCEGENSHFISSDTLLDVQFNANSNFSSFWNWDFGDGNNSVLQNPFHTYGSSGTYQVCLNYENSCGNLTICDSISVFCTFPIVELGPDLNLCMGTSVDINAYNGGTTYSWSTGDTTAQIQVTTTGQYFVDAINSCGSLTRDSIQINFHAVPILDIGPDSVICQGDSVSFSNLSGNNFYDFSWYLNNTLIDSDSIYDETFTTYGNYAVKLIASNQGCLDSTLIYVNVLTPLDCNPNLSHCLPTASTGTTQGDYINRVGLNGFDNNNSGATGGPTYSNYYNTHTATLLPGTNYGLTRQYNLVNTMRAGVWIDYNQDGIFDNTTERVFAGSAGVGTSTTYFTTPTNIPCGPTRMRVRLMDAINNAAIHPCNPSVYGETEDYKIVFTCVCPTISINASITDESCLENDGTILVSQNGGINPVEYDWNNSETGNYIDQLSDGNYSVTLTDFNGCVSSAYFTVDNPIIPFSLSATFVEPNCFGDCDGDATVDINGNASFYNVIWDNAAGNQTALTAVSLCAGNYEVMVTDDTGCTDSLTVNLSEPNELLISVDTTFEYNSQCDAIINLNVTGGSGSYSYTWSNGLPPVSSQDSLCAGMYTVTVTDQNGCSITENITISNVNNIGISETFKSDDLKIFPNPVYDFLTIDLINEESVIKEIILTDVAGKIIFINNYSYEKNKNIRLNLSELVPGTYFVSMKMYSNQINYFKLIKD